MLWLLLQLIAWQTITVNQTTPCFLNASAGPDVWRNCGFETDFLAGMLLPWEWISGGYFSMIIVSMFIGVTYLKYHKAIYPIVIGFSFLPVSWFLFPNQFLTWAVIMTGVALGIFIWVIYVRQTKEYG